jgi:hypothetical protein
MQASMSTALYSTDSLMDESASDMNSLLLDTSVMPTDLVAGYPDNPQQQYPTYEAPQPPVPPIQHE